MQARVATGTRRALDPLPKLVAYHLKFLAGTRSSALRVEYECAFKFSLDASRMFMRSTTRTCRHEWQPGLSAHWIRCRNLWRITSNSCVVGLIRELSMIILSSFLSILAPCPRLRLRVRAGTNSGRHTARVRSRCPKFRDVSTTLNSILAGRSYSSSVHVCASVEVCTHFPLWTVRN